jgi:hypothetical protein
MFTRHRHDQPDKLDVPMPWGLTRFHHREQNHFVTFCWYYGRPLFTTDASRRIFASALERVRRSFRLHVCGYVVMPEHVHLLLSEPQQDTLADALKRGGKTLSSHRTAPHKPKPGLSGPPVGDCPERLRLHHARAGVG